MARPLVTGEKPLDWVGSSKRDFLAFPEPVKDDMGNALGLAQFGGKHPRAKPWKGQGPGIFEVVDDHDGNTYRALYTVRSARSSTCCTPSRRSLRKGAGPRAPTSSSWHGD
jgi:phage-related protein